MPSKKFRISKLALLLIIVAMDATTASTPLKSSGCSQGNVQKSSEFVKNNLGGMVLTIVWYFNYPSPFACIHSTSPGSQNNRYQR